jgi:hypothetical protein
MSNLPVEACLFGFDFLNVSSILQFDIRAQIAVNEVSDPIFNPAAGEPQLGTETAFAGGANRAGGWLRRL